MRKSQINFCGKLEFRSLVLITTVMLNFSYFWESNHILFNLLLYWSAYIYFFNKGNVYLKGLTSINPWMILFMRIIQLLYNCLESFLKEHSQSEKLFWICCLMTFKYRIFSKKTCSFMAFDSKVTLHRHYFQLLSSL